MKYLNIYKTVFLVWTLAFLLPVVSFGAEMSIVTEQESASFTQDKEFVVQVVLDTLGVPLNAIEGKISFSTKVLKVVSISDGNSSINFWIDKPKVNDLSEIVFSGLTPGGIVGKDRIIFSVVFKPVSSGVAEINFEDLRLLKNDGVGSEVDAKLQDLVIKISAKDDSMDKTLEVEDTTPPETFLPLLAQNPEIFDGKNFIVFSTQDKESGMSHFELKEGYFGKYKKVESPFVLENQNLDKKIYITAYDNLGNKISVSTEPDNFKSWYKRMKILGIIVLVASLAFYNRKKWPKYVKN